MKKLFIISIFTLFTLSAQKLNIEAQGTYLSHSGDSGISDVIKNLSDLVDPSVGDYFGGGMGYEFGARLMFDLSDSKSKNIGTILAGAFYTVHTVDANYSSNAFFVFGREISISSFFPYIGFGKKLNDQFFAYALIGTNSRQYKSVSLKTQSISITLNDGNSVTGKEITYQYDESTSFRFTLGVDIEKFIAKTPFLMGLAFSYEVGATHLKSLIGKEPPIIDKEISDNVFGISIKIGYQFDFSSKN